MRLIDANRLKSKITGYIKPHEFKEEIDKAPTAKAIPIEWIDHYIKRKVKIDGINEEVLYINDMLKSWENENEID